MNTNAPTSMQGNLIRYGVYLVLYLIVFGLKSLSVIGYKVHLVGVICFVLFSLVALLFYIRRFNREKHRYFQSGFSLSFLGDYGFILAMTILVIAGRILIAYMQAKGELPLAHYQALYAKRDSTPLFWFLIFSHGFILPALQQFLTVGFFFNYAFRKSSLVTGILGIFCSGLFFSILNFQCSLSLFVIDVIIGMALAWTYLYSQSMWIPICLAILNGIFAIVLI